MINKLSPIWKPGGNNNWANWIVFKDKLMMYRNYWKMTRYLLTNIKIAYNERKKDREEYLRLLRKIKSVL